MSQLPAEPRSAYVHIPFCRHKCGYCDFSVIADRADLQSAFLDALETELQRMPQPAPVDTLFVGGGTPTELSESALSRLFSILQKWLPLSAGGEFTVECNPEGLTAVKIDLLAGHHVNRLSIGVQSFADAKLRRLDRIHTSRQAVAALESARPHFRRLSIDLMFAAPLESNRDWQQDLRRALASPIDHLSTYGLSFEKGTRFWSDRNKQKVVEIDEERQREMYLFTIEQMTDVGWDHYEVSSFAQPACRCRHNEVYWTGRPYLAFGPGAASFVGKRRSVNHRSTLTYIRRLSHDQSPVAETEDLDDTTLARERMVFGLRRLQGVSLLEFEDETGLEPWHLFGSALPWMVDEGLLTVVDGVLKMTPAGLLVSDSLWPQLL